MNKITFFNICYKNNIVFRYYLKDFDVELFVKILIDVVFITCMIMMLEKQVKKKWSLRIKTKKGIGCLLLTCLGGILVIHANYNSIKSNTCLIFTMMVDQDYILTPISKFCRSFMEAVQRLKLLRSSYWKICKIDPSSFW